MPHVYHYIPHAIPTWNAIFCQVILILLATDSLHNSGTPGVVLPSPRYFNLRMLQFLSEFLTYYIVPFEIFMYLLTVPRVFFFSVQYFLSIIFNFLCQQTSFTLNTYIFYHLSTYYRIVKFGANN